MSRLLSKRANIEKRISLALKVQRSAKRLVHGCKKFVPALAYLFCLTLPGSNPVEPLSPKVLQGFCAAPK